PTRAVPPVRSASGPTPRARAALGLADRGEVAADAPRWSIQPGPDGTRGPDLHAGRPELFDLPAGRRVYRATARASGNDPRAGGGTRHRRGPRGRGDCTTWRPGAPCSETGDGPMGWHVGVSPRAACAG